MTIESGPRQSPQSAPSLPFRWEDLPTRSAGDKSYRAATADAQWSAQLADGRRIFLTWLRQSETHGGVLAGSPRQSCFNDLLVKSAIENVARERGADASTIAVLAPQMVVVRGRKRPTDPGPEEYDLLYLPPIESVGIFTSLPIDEAEGEYSMAVVLWYQEAYGPPTPGHVVEQFRTMDWARVARDVGY